jgi:hypothetical protein
MFTAVECLDVLVNTRPLLLAHQGALA